MVLTAGTAIPDRARGPPSGPSAQCPVKASELAALAGSFQILSSVSLTSEPGIGPAPRPDAAGDPPAHGAYQPLKAAAAAYPEAELEVLFTAAWPATTAPP